MSTTTCPKCGSCLLPVGDGTNAICGAHVDGKCDAGRLLPNPGERVCLNAYLREKLPVAQYDKNLKRWKLPDGKLVKRGRGCRHALGWNVLSVGDKPAAQFGDNLAIRLVEPAPPATYEGREGGEEEASERSR